MIPEIHAHFSLDFSNVCNWCSSCCVPKELYVSKHEVVEAWDDARGTMEDAVASYVRLRQIARRRFSEYGLDGNAGLAELDKQIDLAELSKKGCPPSSDALAKTAQAIEEYLKGNGVETQGGILKTIAGWFS